MINKNLEPKSLEERAAMFAARLPPGTFTDDASNFASPPSGREAGMNIPEIIIENLEWNLLGNEGELPEVYVRGNGARDLRIAFLLQEAKRVSHPDHNGDWVGVGDEGHVETT